VLYLDSSALVKGYLQEIGSRKLRAKIGQITAAKVPVLTSFLSHAEINAVLARKLKDGSLPTIEYHQAIKRFESDWRTYLTLIELRQVVLNIVPDLVRKHPLRGSDAVQLASAIWAANATHSRGKMQTPVVFATSDKQLAIAAESEQFEIFNPETP